MYLFPYGRGKVSLPNLLHSKDQDDSDQSEVSKSIKSKQILSNFRCKGIVGPNRDVFQSPKQSLDKVIRLSSEIEFCDESDECVTKSTSDSEPIMETFIKATHASRSLLCLLRTQSLKTKEIKAYNMQDNFVINTCLVKVKFQVPEGQSHENRLQHVSSTLFPDEEKAKKLLDEQRKLYPFEVSGQLTTSSAS